MLHEQYAWVASRAIDATTTTLDFPTHGRPFVLIEVLSSSSLSMKAGVMGKVGTDRKVRSFLLSGASTETSLDPDTATGTVAAQDFIMVPCIGAKTVRMTRAAGDGTIQGVANPSDALTAWALFKMIDILNAGIVASDPASTPFYTVCDGTDELLISASARRLTALHVFSLNDLPVYSKAYDKATAAAETDTPVWGAFSPSNATAANGAGSNPPVPAGGISLTNGLSVRTVKGLADNNDTAVDASEVLVVGAYRTS